MFRIYQKMEMSSSKMKISATGFLRSEKSGHPDSWPSQISARMIRGARFSIKNQLFPLQIKPEESVKDSLADFYFFHLGLGTNMWEFRIAKEKAGERKGWRAERLANGKVGEFHDRVLTREASVKSSRAADVILDRQSGKKGLCI